MTNSDFYWEIFNTTGSLTAYLLYLCNKEYLR